MAAAYGQPAYKRVIEHARKDRIEARKGVTDDERSEIKEAFDIFDSDGSGSIDARVRSPACVPGGGLCVGGMDCS